MYTRVLSPVSLNESVRTVPRDSFASQVDVFVLRSFHAAVSNLAEFREDIFDVFDGEITAGESVDVVDGLEHDFIAVERRRDFHSQGAAAAVVALAPVHDGQGMAAAKCLCRHRRPPPSRVLKTGETVFLKSIFDIQY